MNHLESTKQLLKGWGCIVEPIFSFGSSTGTAACPRHAPRGAAAAPEAQRKHGAFHSGAAGAEIREGQVAEQLSIFIS